METYLTIIKATLSDWILVTLNNPYYAVALAAAAFLLTAIVYSIRIASLKKANVAGENTRIETQNNLNAAQQKMQLMQEELAANTEQMQKDRQASQKETERAAKLEELLSQRNKQVAGIIQSLHTSIDLGERPVPLMGDIKAEGLWQQHERVITLLTTRLQSEQQAKTQLQQSYQAETVKRAEKETLIETLQTALAAQTSQFSKLEHELEEQKSLLQQQQDAAQQVLSQTLEKHLAELARLTELEQQTLELVNTRQLLTQLETKLNVKDALITKLEKDKSVDQINIPAQPVLLKQETTESVIEVPKTAIDVPPLASDIKQQPVNPVKEQTGGVAGKLKDLFGKAKLEPTAAEPKAAEIKQDEEEIQPEPLILEQPPVSAAKEQTGGMAGKIKNLFSAAKQEIMTGEAKGTEMKKDEEEIQPMSLGEEQPPVNAVKEQTAGVAGKIKSLFGKAKQEIMTGEAMAAEIKKYEEEIQPMPLGEEQPPVSAVKEQRADVAGKIKNLFGKAKQEIMTGEPESTQTRQDEEQTQPALSDEEQQTVSAAKSQLGKLKNLFAKTK